VLDEEVPNGDLASNVRFMRINLPSKTMLKRVQIGETRQFPRRQCRLSVCLQCCRNRRPTVRPNDMRAVLLNQSWRGLRTANNPEIFDIRYVAPRPLGFTSENVQFYSVAARVSIPAPWD